MIPTGNLLTLAILLIMGIFTFIVSNVVWDLFGMTIKTKVKNLLPTGTSTGLGEVVR
jgi:hypothetical protein